MRSGYGELGRPMIERGRRPDSRGVASLALVTEIRKSVRWTRWLRVVGLVTLEAIRICEFVVPIDVA